VDRGRSITPLYPTQTGCAFVTIGFVRSHNVCHDFVAHDIGVFKVYESQPVNTREHALKAS
jgi:hypothetical protein